MVRWFPLRTTLCLAAVWGACGCDYSKYERGHPVSDRALREARPLDLAAASNTPPTTRPAVTTLPTTRSADELLPPPPAEVRLTLEECRQLALANNLNLKVELFNPAIARENVNQERAQFESVFTASTAFSVTDQATASELEGAQGRNWSSRVGVNVPLRTGGRLRFELPFDRFETNNRFATLNPAYSSDFAASITHPLLRGFGPEVQSQGIRIATYQYQQSQARTKLQVISILADVDRLYWRVYAARQLLDVRKKEYDLAVAQLDRARRQAQVGVVPEVDVVRAESGVADRIEGIITAETDIRDAQRELKQSVNRPGLGPATPTVIIPASDPNALHYDLDPARLVRAAIDRRMEMLETEIQIAIDATNVRAARNALLPLLTLDYTYNVNGLGRSAPDSFQLLKSARFQDHRVGLALEVPIGNEAAESRLRQALLSRLQTIATKEQRALLIEREVLSTADRLDANWQRILAAGRRVILAARVVDVETRQFNQGLRTSTDVLIAQAALADAQSAEIVAITEYQIAQVDLAFATGTVLGAANVRWEPTSLGQRPAETR